MPSSSPSTINLQVVYTAVAITAVACLAAHVASPDRAEDARKAACTKGALEQLYASFDFVKSLDFLDFDKLKALFGSGDPLLASLVMTYAIIFGCWSGSVLTGDYSMVDRVWSVSPAAFVCYFAYRNPTPRALIMAACTFTWGARLTYNFARKGGYKLGHEDYRWPILRSMMSPLAYQVFNITFIASYQNVLLLLIALPAYPVFLAGASSGFGPIDVLATIGFVSMLALETAADQQQWDFQTAKYGPNPPKTADIKRGFLTEGLFRYSRHPNFFAEQSMWWSIWLFSVGATGVWFNWTLAGPVLLSLLFQGSTAFTEQITLGKYKKYAEYQQCTSRLVPFPRFRELKDR